MTNQSFIKNFRLFLFIIFLLALVPPFFTAQAGIYDEIKFKPNVTIPGADSEFKKAGAETPMETTGEGGNLLMIRYIVALYKFFVGIAGIIAVFMIVFGGVLWLFSGGSSESISKAKEIIVGSITGLLLAVGSYLILFTVNPGLVGFSISIPTVPPVNPDEIKICDYYDFSEAKLEYLYGNCGEKFNVNTVVGKLADQSGCIFVKCPKEKICTNDGMGLWSCKSSVRMTFADSVLAANGNTITNDPRWNGIYQVGGATNDGCGQITYRPVNNYRHIGWECGGCSQPNDKSICWYQQYNKKLEINEISVNNGNQIVFQQGTLVNNNSTTENLPRNMIGCACWCWPACKD